MTDETPSLLVLMPVEIEGDATDPGVPDSEVVPCDGCEQACWISQSGSNMIDEGHITHGKFCIFCALERTKEGHDE